MNFEKTRLYFIPYSGGNFNSYAGFKKFMPQHIEIINLELPGRGKRIREPLLYGIDDMVSDLFKQIKDSLDAPYAIYGHSLGALLGILLCRHISEKNCEQPKGLFVSGQTAPSLIKSEDTHLKPDNSFIETIREMGGTPDELLNDAGFMRYFLPVIRADFQAISNYKYQAGNALLNVPITVMLGHDEKISDNEVMRWQEESCVKISVHRFSGGHFFIFDNMNDICDLISDSLVYTNN